MAKIHAFKGFRPDKEKVNEVASRPYDVLNSAEAREEVKENPWSFLHVVKPEVDLPEGTDLHSDLVYNKGRDNLQKLIAEGYFVEDDSERLYVYGQTMFGRTQFGIVACASVDDYLENIIKKHELTRDINNILFHPAFPVDIRHNAKIFREKLAPWAKEQLK